MHNRLAFNDVHRRKIRYMLHILGIQLFGCPSIKNPPKEPNSLRTFIRIIRFLEVVLFKFSKLLAGTIHNNLFLNLIHNVHLHFDLTPRIFLINVLLYAIILQYFQLRNIARVDNFQWQTNLDLFFNGNRVRVYLNECG